MAGYMAHGGGVGGTGRKVLLRGRVDAKCVTSTPRKRIAPPGRSTVMARDRVGAGALSAGSVPDD